MKQLFEGSPGTWIVGTLVLALVGFGTSHWRTLLGFATADARITAAIIYGTFTLVGIVLSAGVTVVVAGWKERRERNSIATVLLTEIMAQADMIATLGSYANAESSANRRMYPEELARSRPPEAAIYKALADRIVLLSPEAASAVVTFYGATERAKQLSELLPERAAPQSSRDAFNNLSVFRTKSDVAELQPRVVDGFRAAARNGVAAIKALRPYVKASRIGVGSKKVEGLIEELAQIALANGTPRHKGAETPDIARP